jgi:hypothetical protein
MVRKEYGNQALPWKQELVRVHDNPDFIEWQIEDIQNELKNDHPRTDVLRGSINRMLEWTHEIDLAHKRAEAEKKTKEVGI